MSEIDWSTELRKIERQFDGLPPEPSPALKRARREAERRERRRKEQQAALLGAWVRLLLVGALGAALAVWPYPRECGVGLFAYLGAEGILVAGALFAAAWTWHFRLAKSHTVTMLLVLWGLALLAAQVLPRVGYAKVDPKHPPRWSCAAPASPPAIR